jgi:4'-phosphopantetheinyl transferase
VIDGVHIWRAALDGPGWPGPGGLPGDERERAEGLLREQAARRWVAARWALRQALSQYLEVEPASVELEIDENGKPRLAAGGGPEFNLSHSGGLALVAVSDRQVGIDVELIVPRHDLPALAERALPVTDAAAVRAASEDDRAGVFYAAWTRHEARVKCLGSGLGSAPGRAGVAVEGLEVAPGYAAAVAVAWTEVGPVRCRSLP